MDGTDDEAIGSDARIDIVYHQSKTESMFHHSDVAVAAAPFATAVHSI